MAGIKRGEELLLHSCQDESSTLNAAPLLHSAKRAASRLAKPPPSRARGDALGLVDLVLSQKEFRDRAVLDHIAPQAFGFAAALLARRVEKEKGRVWILCPDVKTQDHVHAELGVWQCPALYFPRLGQLIEGALADPELLAERTAVLSRMADDASAVMVLCADSLDEPAPALAAMTEQKRMLVAGAKLDVEQLLHELSEAGYERVPVVTERGQFARRGGIVDFFSWQAEEPLRLEFFDDELESIRAFDLHNQSSIRRLESAGVILSMSDGSDETGLVRDHQRKDDFIIQIEGESDLGAHARILSGAAEVEGMEDFTAAIHENPLGVFDASDFVLHEARRELFTRQITEWHTSGWRTVIFFHNEAERERFNELQSKLPSSVETKLGLLYRGFTVPAAKLAVLTGAEIFGRHQPIRRVRGSKLDEAETLRKARDVLSELREGDLVVHSEHGIGRYAGIEVREGGKKEEVLVLHYAEGAKLFVPLAHVHLVSRYVGVGGKAPSLSKLSEQRWKKTRQTAEKSVEDFAKRMLSVAAERQTLKAYSHPPDTKWQVEFEESFLYRETPDQLRSAEEIKRDMEADKPMDRLLCADVGFGKTEVAIRAAFKAVMGGRQVAILVPTTVLARQHHENIRQRMSEFPVTVEMLCRLTSANKEREIVKGISEGTVDIVVGTHRVISKDVRFKNLGLAVIDEEQRFGVKHKEKFKDLFRLVDVLTLSATPIPRTLYLALMGMRDMSTIETPPPNKQAVQTQICPYDERIIRQAIESEIERGGQVFFLHNRVMTIERTADRIQNTQIHI